MKKSIASNLEAVRKRLKQSAATNVRIMAVGKFQPIEKLLEAVKAGVDCIGVNYAQEGDLQREALKGEKVSWHFIGHIQSRKVKHLPVYDCVESLDRMEIAEALNTRCEAVGKKLSVLVEVNIGAEDSKSGILPSAIPPFLKQLSAFSFLVPSGLMLMPPPLEIEERRPFFHEGRRWFDRLKGDYPFTTLSMGTSEDYWVAAEEGSTLIRLGTSLLGPRPAKV